MNLYHLKYFYDSARLKSVSRAAQLNSIGQPAVSKAIQNLEASLKKDLISHKRNRFHLTDEGETVFSLCHKIFSATDELTAAVQNDLEVEGELGLACTSSMAECLFLASSLKNLDEKNRKLKIRLSLGRTDLVRDWVNSGKVDLGIVLDNIDLAGFETVTLAKGQYLLVRSPKYKGDWHQDGALTVEPKREVLELRSKYKNAFGKAMKTKMEIGSWSVIRRFVHCGMGVGFVPDYLVREDMKKKTLLAVEPKKLSVKYEIKVIRDPKRFFSRKSKTVIEELGQSASRVGSSLT